MTATDTLVPFDPYRLGRARVDDPARGHGAGGPAAKRVIVAYGFWIFLLSDIVMFSAFFASYAVLAGNTNGGPSGRDVFDLRNLPLRWKGVDNPLAKLRALPSPSFSALGRLEPIYRRGAPGPAHIGIDTSDVHEQFGILLQLGRARLDDIPDMDHR